MKKIVLIFVAVIAVALILFGIAMGVKKYKENNALATADPTVNVSDNMGTISVNENVAEQMLSQYPLEYLGIPKQINQYVIKLKDGVVYDKQACLVELYLTEDAEVPEATFAISGYDCFVYDVTKNEYLLLTMDGRFSVEVSATNQETTLFYDDSNNTALHKIIDAFSKEDLGFQKEPQEYIMVVTGTSVKALDGKSVYVVRMYEQDGTETNYTCAIDNEIVYKFDTIQKGYVSVVSE